MSDLLQRLKAVEHDATSRVRPCRMQQVIDGLEQSTADLLNKLLDNPKVSTRVIYNALRDDGIAIDRQKISEHRNGDCRCQREDTV